ncbi:MAG: hypothetical protein N2V77_02860 [Canidatus Methanoxibalbensis ujae]|nr:hypothetical protein [Candidatus Methanoxibalbensis ujae]
MGGDCSHTISQIANKLRYPVAGTANKSELMMRYFTYGDGGADILPLSNLYKTEVRRLNSSEFP